MPSMERRAGLELTSLRSSKTWAEIKNWTLNWATQVPPKSHYRICLPPLLAPTITGWIPHGARQTVSKGALSGYLEGDWKEARLSKERNCTAKPAQQSVDNPVRELNCPSELPEVQGKHLAFICSHQPVIRCWLPWEKVEPWTRWLFSAETDLRDSWKWCLQAFQNSGEPGWEKPSRRGNVWTRTSFLFSHNCLLDLLVNRIGF